MKGLLLFILITIGVSASAQDEVLSVIDGALDSLAADGGLVEDEKNIVFLSDVHVCGLSECCRLLHV